MLEMAVRLVRAGEGEAIKIEAGTYGWAENVVTSVWPHLRAVLMWLMLVSPIFRVNCFSSLTGFPFATFPAGTS